MNEIMNQIDHENKKKEKFRNVFTNDGKMNDEYKVHGTITMMTEQYFKWLVNASIYPSISVIVPSSLSFTLYSLHYFFNLVCSI